MRKRVKAKKKNTDIRKAVHLLLCKKCGGNHECTRKYRQYKWWEEGYWKQLGKDKLDQCRQGREWKWIWKCKRMNSSGNLHSVDVHLKKDGT